MKNLFLLCFLLCLLLTAACGSRQTAETALRSEGLTESVFYTVKAPVDGKIRGLILDTGERIRKSQPLFDLGTQDEDPAVEKAATELAKAQARLNRASQGNTDAERASAAAALQEARKEAGTAEQNYAKMHRLYEIGGTSRLKMEQARQNLDSAKARLAAAQARLAQVSRAYTPEELDRLKQEAGQAKLAYDAAVLSVEGSEIDSPVTGTVKEIWARNGETVKKGQPVLQLVSSSECVIKISLSRPDPRIAEGTEALVAVSGSNKKFPAVVRKAEAGSLTLYSDRKPEDLPEGTSVEVTISFNK